MARKAMAIATNAAYSPDLAPSNFYLFGHLKQRFGRESFETGERSFSAIEGVYQSLEK
jgi:hypothetical protein